MFIIKNKKTDKILPIDIYCGRGSPLGNPFSHLENSKAEFKVKTREESIIAFEKYLQEQIKNKNPKICNELNKIFKISKNNPNTQIGLVCFCFPKSCHTQIIKKIIEEKLTN